MDAWRCSMGWSEVAARSHARRLELEGWLARYPMTRGEGSLFLATRAGIAVSGVPVRAACPPAADLVDAPLRSCLDGSLGQAARSRPNRCAGAARR